MPQRKWRVYVAASAHTDIGYTDVQPNCAERHCQNIDAAIDLFRRFPDFRWNLEVAWQAENYVHSRSGQRLADFYRFAREGKIGIQALYCNMLTGLCSHEEACRLTWFAHKLCREQGIPYRSAMISDVPSAGGLAADDPGRGGHPLFQQRDQQRPRVHVHRNAEQVPLLVGRPRRQPRA